MHLEVLFHKVLLDHLSFLGICLEFVGRRLARGGVLRKKRGRRYQRRDVCGSYYQRPAVVLRRLSTLKVSIYVYQLIDLAMLVLPNSIQNVQLRTNIECNISIITDIKYNLY